MKILLHSNSPAVQTGYGIQTAQFARRLRDAGHEIAIVAYFGHDRGIGEWEGIPLLPCPAEQYGNDFLTQHAEKWFEGDLQGGWIIPITDVFGLLPAAQNGLLSDFNVAPWTPVDHDPVPQACVEFLVKSESLPIAMSKWGKDRLEVAGLDPLYAPLAIDTNIFQPVPDAKAVCGMDDDRFLVMMNGMNKGWMWDRKGFWEAFAAFGQFSKQHPDALLYMHTEARGPQAGGIDLVAMAQAAGIAEHQIRFANQYAYMNGFIPAEQLAALYSAADVLLAPSRGEGFCLPVIEAQACGTPVIVTDFAAQPELVGAGWKVPGQAVYDPPQQSRGVVASIPAIIQALEASFAEQGSEENRAAAMAMAAHYDADVVFDKFWRPILTKLEGGDAVPLDRTPMPKLDAVDVLVPVLDRPQNVAPLVSSFRLHTPKGAARLVFVVDEDDLDERKAIEEADAEFVISTRGSTYAQKVNSGFEQTTAPWVFICGDDVRFHRGWLDAARKLSDKFDVIGTNDSPEGAGNPKVRNGSHADHFFIRRAYADKYGASLGAPIAHEGYRHFYTDVEIVELAKARRVFTPCLDSMVEHLHPDLGKSDIDDTYRAGWSARGHDEKEWRRRAALVAMQREGAGKVRAA